MQFMTKRWTLDLVAVLGVFVFLTYVDRNVQITVLTMGLVLTLFGLWGFYKFSRTAESRIEQIEVDVKSFRSLLGQPSYTFEMVVEPNWERIAALIAERAGMSPDAVMQELR